MDEMKIKNAFVWLGVALVSLTLNSCKKEDGGTIPAPSKPAVDLANWKADPNLPKPQITATVEIIKDSEHKKISMKVTAEESNGLTVHEIQFMLKYRVFNEESQKHEYPEGTAIPKMIPKIEKGAGVFQTPIVEKALREVAWESNNDNWEVEIRSYNQYYKE